MRSVQNAIVRMDEEGVFCFVGSEEYMREMPLLGRDRDAWVQIGGSSVRDGRGILVDPFKNGGTKKV